MRQKGFIPVDLAFGLVIFTLALGAGLFLLTQYYQPNSQTPTKSETNEWPQITSTSCMISFAYPKGWATKTAHQNNLGCLYVYIDPSQKTVFTLNNLRDTTWDRVLSKYPTGQKFNSNGIEGIKVVDNKLQTTALYFYKGKIVYSLTLAGDPNLPTNQEVFDKLVSYLKFTGQEPDYNHELGGPNQTSSYRDTIRKGDVSSIAKLLEENYGKEVSNMYPGVKPSWFLQDQIPKDPLGTDYSGIPTNPVKQFEICANLEGQSQKRFCVKNQRL